MRKKTYASPRIKSDKSFETSALACAKTSDPPYGAWHFAHAYDTFSGHWGPGFGTGESVTGTAGIGFGSGLATSLSYNYVGLCGNWITFAS